MKFLIAFLICMLGSPLAFAGPSPEVRTLSEQDREIYYETFESCRPATVSSAFRIAFSPSYLLDGVNNWVGIVSLQPDAVMARWDSGLQSPRIAMLRKSRGFWLALGDCYGYRYGEINHGLLMKQIVDLGHLSSELGNLAAGIAFATTSKRIVGGLFKRFPIASRFVFASLLSLQINETLRVLWSIYGPPSEAEKVQRKLVQEQIFREPDRVIKKSKDDARLKLAEIDDEISRPETHSARRSELMAKRAIIVKAFENLNQIQKELAQQMR